MKKIILAGLLKDRNLGDIVIADCTKYLYNEETKSIPDVEYAGLDLSGLIHKRNARPFLLKKAYGAYKRVNKILGTSAVELNKAEHIKHYEAQVKDAALIVIVGGGMIKYKYQLFWIYLSGLIAAANKYGVPVVLNALGVEGYDEHDAKCQYLKKGLNMPNVKAVTTRDDIDTLQNLYLKGNTHVMSRQVADPAVHAAVVYGVEKDPSSNVIGVGIVRGNIFTDNDVPVSKSDLAKLYADIFTELDKRNIRWKAFTNGLPSDVELAEEIFTLIGKPQEAKNVLVPKTSLELTKIISGFKGVIAARLHATIISYSLNIPAIGLVWNDKLPLFGKSIGYEERFITHDKFDKKYIVDRLETALTEGYDPAAVAKYKATITDSIKDILTITKIKG